ncbi:c-type cytochrome biogenesis protein CcmI [Denitromonas halophila]|uniref:C-type cytochrome biogenesis protein CcmI n=1 Tax=Denitromonas halophila TaxID=1629404 RepID=A0A557R0J5_9RHOO|nr:c-type cytochrome biogenesis protein CcmI [Denitromonas halophila]TVO58673.1 c-type cytochrome biogenesis protein CcmI [Denitromonas halophila]
MTSFIVFAVLLVVAALLMVVVPLFRNASGAQLDDDANALQTKTALSVLREQLAELDADVAAGDMSQSDYQRTRDELERRALEEGETRSGTLSGKPARGWGMATALLIPLLAGVIYLDIGSLDGLDPTQVGGEDTHQVTQEQVEEMVATLAERLKQDPENAEGWFMLARSYSAMGRFADAATAYGELAKRMPDEAQVYADWADALAAGNNRSLVGEPSRLIDKALSLEPDNIKALALSGSAAFQASDFAKAAAQWERMLAQLPAESELATSIRQGIAEARQKAGMAPAAAAPAVAPGAGISLAGTVALSPALIEKAKADDVVFIYVRPEGGGMPFAILRKTVADLPVQFDFAGVPSMAGDRPIPATVEIGARVSKSGNAGARPGDLDSSVLAVPPDASGVNLLIETELAQ